MGAPSSFPRRASTSQRASRRPLLPPLHRVSLPVSAALGQCRGVRLVRVFPLAEPCSCSAGVFVEDDISLGFNFSLAFQADLVSCRSLVYHMYSWFVELLVVASYMLCTVRPFTRFIYLGRQLDLYRRTVNS